MSRRSSNKKLDTYVHDFAAMIKRAKKLDTHVELPTTLDGDHYTTAGEYFHRYVQEGEWNLNASNKFMTPFRKDLLLLYALQTAYNMTTSNRYKSAQTEKYPTQSCTAETQTQHVQTNRSTQTSDSTLIKSSSKASAATQTTTPEEITSIPTSPILVSTSTDQPQTTLFTEACQEPRQVAQKTPDPDNPVPALRAHSSNQDTQMTVATSPEPIQEPNERPNHQSPNVSTPNVLTSKVSTPNTSTPKASTPNVSSSASLPTPSKPKTPTQCQLFPTPSNTSESKHVTSTLPTQSSQSSNTPRYTPPHRRKNPYRSHYTGSRAYTPPHSRTNHNKAHYTESPYDYRYQPRYQPTPTRSSMHYSDYTPYTGYYNTLPPHHRSPPPPGPLENYLSPPPLIPPEMLRLYYMVGDMLTYMW